MQNKLIVLILAIAVCMINIAVADVQIDMAHSADGMLTVVYDNNSVSYNTINNGTIIPFDTKINYPVEQVCNFTSMIVWNSTMMRELVMSATDISIDENFVDFKAWAQHTLLKDNQLFIDYSTNNTDLYFKYKSAQQTIVYKDQVIHMVNDTLMDRIDEKDREIAWQGKVILILVFALCFVIFFMAVDKLGVIQKFKEKLG